METQAGAQADTPANKSDKMTAEEAGRIRVLVSEDIRKYELEIARHEAAVGTLRVYIAECRATLADIDRREAGIMYPEPVKPVPVPEPKPANGVRNAQMGEITGGQA